MSLRKIHNSFAFLALLAVGGLAASTLHAQAIRGPISVSSGLITNGTNTPLQAVPGNAPNGNSWASYVTGSNPVAYFDISTGSLMFDSKGRSVNSVDFRWGTVGTISSTTPGPYVFTTGTGNGAVSTGVDLRTLPAGFWSAVTTFPARLSGNVSLTTAGTLSTSGANISSTDGWFNQPWGFGAIAPSVTTLAQMYSTTAGQGFRSLTAGGDLLGYGAGIGMFLFIQAPSTGNQYGAIVPVQPVPEPSTILLAGLGVAGLAAAQLRRRRSSTAVADTTAI